MSSLPDKAQSIKRQALLDQAQAIVGIVESAYEGVMSGKGATLP